MVLVKSVFQTPTPSLDSRSEDSGPALVSLSDRRLSDAAYRWAFILNIVPKFVSKFPNLPRSMWCSRRMRELTVNFESPNASSNALWLIFSSTWSFEAIWAVSIRVWRVSIGDYWRDIGTECFAVLYKSSRQLNRYRFENAKSLTFIRENLKSFLYSKVYSIKLTVWKFSATERLPSNPVNYRD